MSTQDSAQHSEARWSESELSKTKMDGTDSTEGAISIGAQDAADDPSHGTTTDDIHEPSDAKDQKNKDKDDGGDGDDEEDGDKYITGLALVLLTIAILSTVFIVALSNTIISTAIPTLTSVFHSYDDIAWYTSGESITATAFQLPFGRAYALLNLKWTFLTSLVVYLVGSLVCAVAQNSATLIVGRAISGVGNAGVFTGVFIIIARNIPLRKRALYAGLIGATFTIAAVLGPILGGLFTTNVSWRWCFYINLPIGGVAVLLIFFFLSASLGKTSKELKGLTKWQLLLKFDPLGTALILTASVCLLLALQWGGAAYPWDSGRVIAVFVMAGVTFIAWVVLQYLQGDEATVPPSVVTQRSVAGASLYSVFLSASLGIIIYYLPLWYQSVQGETAEKAGLKQLGIVIGLTLAAVGAGGLVVKTGYYNPFIIGGTILSSVGAGLLYTIQIDTYAWRILGYQFVFAAGIGMSLEQCNVAVQTVLPDDKIPQGTSLVLFSRVLGTALSGPVAQSVLQQGLVAHLGHSVAALVYADGGATDVRGQLEKLYGAGTPALKRALQGLNDAVTKTFLVALVLACMTVLCIPLFEWKSVKKEKRENEDRKEGKKGKKDEDEKKDEKKDEKNGNSV